MGLLEEQNRTREPDLVPVRHGRMLVSPFTFYRGAAKIMAADLEDTPTAGLQVQLCGDAHLSNFGVFASPERRLLFDLNDFDETLPGPFEYDVKRMAASFTIAARNNGFGKADTKAATLGSVAAYREAMAGFAEMGTMDIWYAHLDEDELLQGMRSAAKARQDQEEREGGQAGREDAPRRRPRRPAPATACRRCPSSASVVDGQYRIVSQPPIVVPMRDLAATYGLSADEVERGSMSSSAPTGPPCATISASCWSGSSWSMWPARWWGWAASAPGPSSACSRAATSTTRCSCRSRRRPRRSWRARCPRAATSSTASGWCTASG